MAHREQVAFAKKVEGKACRYKLSLFSHD